VKDKLGVACKLERAMDVMVTALTGSERSSRVRMRCIPLRLTLSDCRVLLE